MVAMNRQLPKSHPIQALLEPHLEGTAFINWGAQDVSATCMRFGVVLGYMSVDGAVRGLGSLSFVVLSRDSVGGPPVVSYDGKILLLSAHG